MQICSRLLKHLKLSRSPRFNYTFLRRFVRDDFFAIFFISKHFPLTFCAQGFWKNIFLPPKFVHVLCKFFNFSLADLITAFQKTQFCVEDVLGKGPF